MRQPRVSASTDGEFCSFPRGGAWGWFRYAGFARYSTTGAAGSTIGAAGSTTGGAQLSDEVEAGFDSDAFDSDAFGSAGLDSAAFGLADVDEAPVEGRESVL